MIAVHIVSPPKTNRFYTFILHLVFFLSKKRPKKIDLLAFIKNSTQGESKNIVG
ncbi:hypothetical protein CU023_1220 [Enterococcus faecium]|nr:hypothetical protein [Enterococcus faecium]MBK4874551.1 hypothetical protein [Enterococcus faecium]